MAGAFVGTARSLRSPIRDPKRIPPRAARNSPPDAGSSRRRRRHRPARPTADAGQHAFEDAREAPEREGDEVGDGVDVAPRSRGVAREQRVARREARRQRRVVVVGAERVAAARPTSRARSRRRRAGSPSVQISQSSTARISPCGSTMQLPRRKSPCTTVLSVCWRDARGEQRRARGRPPGRSRVLDASNCACHRLSWRRDELVAPGEVAEPDRVDVDRVQRDQRVDQRLAAVRAGRLVELGARRWRRRAARCRRRTTSRRRARRSRRRRRSTRAPRGTGTGVGPSAAMMRCSRPMSCAVGSTPCSGGRRTTSSRPSASRHARGDVRLPAGDELGGERRRRVGERTRPPSARTTRGRSRSARRRSPPIGP